ncbi:MAG: hypothetical protein ACE5GW_01115 [Planctomycetota bacterium]
MAEEHYPEENGYEDEGGGRLPAWLTETPYWALSAAIHLVVLFGLSTVALLEIKKDEADQRTVVRREFEPKKYDPRKKRDLERKTKILKEKIKKPIQKLKIDKITKKPKGTDLRNRTNKNLMRNSLSDAFGVGPGGSGAYGNRWGKGSLWREGGDDETESAVLAALEWLRRHQHPDGHWSSHEFFQQCADPNKPCAIENPDQAFSDGAGFKGYDVGVTALAMLAFTGFGHTHRDGEFVEFRQVLKKAMQWMKKMQIKSSDPQTNGLYGAPAVEGIDEWVYNHSIATMAMGELLFMSQDRLNLGKSVEAATEWCLRAQNEEYGWKYGYRVGKNDTSVTGWMVLALKTAKACSESRLINVKRDRYKKHFEWALAWFKTATSGVTGITGYENPGDEGSRLQKFYPDPYPFSKDLSCMTAVAVLCRLFAGERRSSDDIKGGVAILMNEVPVWRPVGKRHKSKINIYYWYYASYAMYQFGGKRWKEWNEAMKEALLPPSQRVGGCEDGSWDPIGEWGAAGGRAYSTAIGAMTLEVYYRFIRASELQDTG